MPLSPQPPEPVFPYALHELCLRVETVMNAKMQTAGDFVALSEAVFRRSHRLISPTTFKRLWGYLDEAVRPRRSTLDALAAFVGYPDFARFAEGLSSASEVQSSVSLAATLNASQLPHGAEVTLRWLPDRRCRVRYLGDFRFEVVEAEGTKLAVGDTFRCMLMVEGEPLYLDALVHQGQPPVTYVAGRKDGIRFEL